MPCLIKVVSGGDPVARVAGLAALRRRDFPHRTVEAGLSASLVPPSEGYTTRMGPTVRLIVSRYAMERHFAGPRMADPDRRAALTMFLMAWSAGIVDVGATACRRCAMGDSVTLLRSCRVRRHPRWPAALPAG